MLFAISVEYRNRLVAPQRLGWESIDGFGPAAPFVNDERLEVLTGVAQLPLFDPANLADPTRENFHALTMTSSGLLTDTRLGGLRKDLTVYLEGSGGSADNDPIATATGSYPLEAGEFHNNDRRFQVSGSRPSFGGDMTLSGDGFPNSDTNIPQWGKLKDWATNTGNSGSPLQPKPNTETRRTSSQRPLKLRQSLAPGWTTRCCTAIWDSNSGQTAIRETAIRDTRKFLDSLEPGKSGCPHSLLKNETADPFPL